ncbi:MAG: F0F1 ATP synthase subunit B [Bacteroidota bacterium]
MNALFEFEFGLVFWQFIILVTAFVILGKYAWKPILGFIEKQEKAYAKASKEAKDQQRLAVTLSKQNQQLLQMAEKEKKAILQQALAEKKTLLRQAELEATQVKEDMLQQAQKDMLQEKQEMIKVLKQQIGILTIQVAEKLLQRELDQKNKQDVLLQTLINQASQSPKALCRVK